MKKLSDKIVIDFLLKKEDVKEFIEKLKEELFDEAFKRELPLTDSSLDHLPMAYINKIIDKLAGDKLT